MKKFNCLKFVEKNCWKCEQSHPYDSKRRNEDCCAQCSHYAVVKINQFKHFYEGSAYLSFRSRNAFFFSILRSSICGAFAIGKANCVRPWSSRYAQITELRPEIRSEAAKEIIKTSVTLFFFSFTPSSQTTKPLPNSWSRIRKPKAHRIDQITAISWPVI